MSHAGHNLDPSDDLTLKGAAADNPALADADREAYSPAALKALHAMQDAEHRLPADLVVHQGNVDQLNTDMGNLYEIEHGSPGADVKQAWAIVSSDMQDARGALPSSQTDEGQEVLSHSPEHEQLKVYVGYAEQVSSNHGSVDIATAFGAPENYQSFVTNWRDQSGELEYDEATKSRIREGISRTLS